MKIEEIDTITAILKTEGITDMISCENAHILCDKYQLSHAAFGKCCSENHIRIRRCSFGCFQ